MASAKKQIQQTAQQLFNLTVVNGEITSDRVAGVLEYVEKHRVPNATAVLKAYHRLVAAEIARGTAVVEHAGPVDASALNSIAASMTKRYGRKVTAVARRNDALLAGLRIRVGDDTFESSVAGQLAALSASV